MGAVQEAVPIPVRALQTLTRPSIALLLALAAGRASAQDAHGTDAADAAPDADATDDAADDDAADDDAADDEAREAFEEATRHLNAGRYQLALDGFERSYRLLEGRPEQPMLLYNIGRAQQALGRYEEAIESYERYLREAPPDETYMESARDYIRDMRSRLAQRASSPDATPVVIAGLLLGVGGASLLSAIPTGVVALDDQSELLARCNGTACPPDARALIDELDALSTATDVLWITGVALAAAGAALLVALRLTTPEDPTPSLACMEVGCVGSIRARF
jgi:tetratricopeptide (TPR) repeat protein